ncbi:energy-coupling factor transporter ATPase [Lactobacillus sp. HMSC24D01]|uniref:energy-coupling factor transporter ATPase n=1 Tax=Limosilactobacillus fermentum TaxID=1613 RepID=UPI0008A2A097|nr:energy-coupling factor transporter ATPase [Lactobacillus sp. HMSC24D01]
MAEVKFKQVGYRYQGADEQGTQAVVDLSATIPSGTTAAIIGHTGSGKSTLMQMVDALILPTSGSIQVGDLTIDSQTAKKDLINVHRRVGYVFQFPEKQLFAPTVIEDVAFGPQNLGKDAEEAKQAANRALTALNFPADRLQHSPLELSGGQMRRVALAGVLAMEPDVLILDEPTAGLDPAGQEELLTLVEKLHQQGMTVLMITHQMDQVARLAQQVLVLNQGSLVFDGRPADLFADPDLLQKNHLQAPQSVRFAHRLKQAGVEVGAPLSLNQLADRLATQLGGADNDE